MYFSQWKNYYCITIIKINNFITSNNIVHILYFYVHALYTFTTVMFYIYCAVTVFYYIKCYCLLVSDYVV